MCLENKAPAAAPPLVLLQHKQNIVVSHVISPFFFKEAKLLLLCPDKRLRNSCFTCGRNQSIHFRRWFGVKCCRRMTPSQQTALYRRQRWRRQHLMTQSDSDAAYSQQTSKQPNYTFSPENPQTEFTHGCLEATAGSRNGSSLGNMTHHHLLHLLHPLSFPLLPSAWSPSPSKCLTAWQLHRRL